MTLIGASALRELNKNELRILQAIEVGMKKAQYVEVDQIAKFAGYPVSETERWLQKCHKLDLIHRWTGHFVGYELTIHGYDALALNALYMKNEIKSIGREKGVGKESRVFFALDNDEVEVIMKLHRVGYTSFQHVKKKRRYTANKHHISELYASRLSAETEIKWLQLANEIGLPVPKIITGNRHIVVQEYIDGIDLFKIKEVPNPMEILDKLIEFMKKAWLEGGFIHSDLSEHNVIIRHKDANPIVIDFPQTISKQHENADELLDRDIKNVLTYFERKHGLETQFSKVKDYIKSK